MDKVIKSKDQKDHLSKDSCVKNEDHEPHKVVFQRHKLAMLELHLEYLKCI